MLLIILNYLDTFCTPVDYSDILQQFCSEILLCSTFILYKEMLLFCYHYKQSQCGFGGSK